MMLVTSETLPGTSILSFVVLGMDFIIFGRHMTAASIDVGVLKNQLNESGFFRSFSFGSAVLVSALLTGVAGGFGQKEEPPPAVTTAA